MPESSEDMQSHAELTVELVAAYVARNSVPTGELPALIRNVHQSLAALGSAAPAETVAAPLTPAIPAKKSITPEYIISLEDGRRLKSMKRYLAGLGMTPDEYRTKWGLAKDYPMVAPNYAAQRSALAKTLGLGRKSSTARNAAAEPQAPASVAANDGGKKGRKRVPKAA